MIHRQVQLEDSGGGGWVAVNVLGISMGVLAVAFNLLLTASALGKSSADVAVSPASKRLILSLSIADLLLVVFGIHPSAILFLFFKI